MPWKVLIADDEPKIRRGLVQFLQTVPDEFEVVAEAEDGERALSECDRTQPDLLLIDIRMPFVDGLSLVRSLGERGASSRVIIISGHDEFEYARQAIGLGVFEFLLKPVDEDLLLGTLRRAADDLERSRTQQASLSRVRDLARRGRPLMLDGLFREALQGGVTRTDWDETTELLGFTLEGEPRLVLIAPGDHPGTGGQPLWAGLALRRIAEEAFASFDTVLLAWQEPGFLAVLAEAGDEARWQEALDQVELRARDLLGLVASIDRVAVPGFPDSLPAIWDELVANRREATPHATLATMAMNILDHRFREPDLTLEDLAQELQVSAGHLSRVLKRSLGLPFVEALAKVRVRKATILLSDPAVKVYEVAERVGYASQHYFSRAFRRVLGVSPSDYRKGSR